MAKKEGAATARRVGKKLNLRASEAEFLRISEKAAKRKMTISQYIRFACLGRRETHKSALLRSLFNIWIVVDQADKKHNINPSLIVELQQTMAGLYDAIESANDATLKMELNGTDACLATE